MYILEVEDAVVRKEELNDLEIQLYRKRNQVISNFMQDGKVISVPAKEKKKYILSSEFTKRFEQGKMYSEQEINEELLTMFSKDDYVEQRRYLITFELFKRTSDGTQYWINSDNDDEVAK